MRSTLSQDIQDIGALAMVAVAMGVVGYAAFQGNETALGALIGVISAGTGFYLRGRIATPDTSGGGNGSGGVTVTPGPMVVTPTPEPPARPDPSLNPGVRIREG